MNLRPLAEKFEAFGWFVQEIDGHDLAAVIGAYESRQGDQGPAERDRGPHHQGLPDLRTSIQRPESSRQAADAGRGEEGDRVYRHVNPQLQRDKDKD